MCWTGVVLIGDDGDGGSLAVTDWGLLVFADERAVTNGELLVVADEGAITDGGSLAVADEGAVTDGGSLAVADEDAVKSCAQTTPLMRKMVWWTKLNFLGLKPTMECIIIV